MAEKRDYYEVLGVTREVSVDVIKKAYRKKALQYHPDRNPGDKQAEEKFKEVSEAYAVLSDAEKRRRYDQFGHAAFQGGAGAGGFGGFAGQDPFDIFREVFGGGGGIFESFFGGGSRREETGDDIQYRLEITLEEAASGVEKEISFMRMNPCGACGATGAAKGSKVKTCSTCGGRGRVSISRGFFSMVQPCPHCHGTGQVVEKPCEKCGGEGRVEEQIRVKVAVPAGIESGQKIRIAGQGEAGPHGARPGDLYVLVRVKAHKIFEREGANLAYILPVKFTLLALGGAVEVPTLNGKAELKIPAGTPSGTLFRLRGKGMPQLRSSSKGDLVIRVEVEVPKKLTNTQQEKLRAFADACGDRAAPIEESFSEKIKRFFNAD